jgi:homoserine dehydrogenase
MIGVGIIGLGTVGRGTYEILRQYGPLIQHKTGVDVRVVKIAEIDPARCQDLKNDDVQCVRNADELINDDQVDIGRRD